MNDSCDLDTNKDQKESDTFAAREVLCRNLTELIWTGSEDLANVGFSPEMVRFDCLMTVKIIVDALYDEFNVGHARKEWYREYVRVASR